MCNDALFMWCDYSWYYGTYFWFNRKCHQLFIFYWRSMFLIIDFFLLDLNRKLTWMASLKYDIVTFLSISCWSLVDIENVKVLKRLPNIILIRSVIIIFYQNTPQSLALITSKDKLWYIHKNYFENKESLNYLSSFVYFFGTFWFEFL